jgi:hypothetical protein
MGLCESAKHRFDTLPPSSQQRNGNQPTAENDPRKHSEEGVLSVQQPGNVEGPAAVFVSPMMKWDRPILL